MKIYIGKKALCSLQVYEGLFRQMYFGRANAVPFLHLQYDHCRSPYAHMLVTNEVLKALGHVSGRSQESLRTGIRCTGRLSLPGYTSDEHSD